MRTNHLANGDAKQKLLLKTPQDVFTPTDTSNLLIDACKSVIASPKKILDIGCGSGFVGIALATLGLCKGPLFASDISKEAVAFARKNAQKVSIPYIARQGSLFEPWNEELFDVIVDDVAGISDDIAKLSSWYPPGVTCDAGRDGAKWITGIIEQSKKYLEPNGILLFPILSLSNEKRILHIAQKTYGYCTLIMKRDWFLPDDIADNTDIIESLLLDGSIYCEKKFGKWIWTTAIYMATNETPAIATEHPRYGTYSA